jgi:Zn-dependent peptidase ImmA (M78 family)/DNA-binding XRE family transcriptional regulator
MNLIEKQIFGGRLKLARKMAGMSLQELSDKLCGIVTKQSLNKYEQSLMMPSDLVLLKIANILNLKTDYFFRNETIVLSDISFRKNTNLSKTIQDTVIEKARDYVERYTEIENVLGINCNFQNPISNLIIRNSDDVELAANLLRKEWEFGFSPIPNIGKTLELRGIKVFLCKVDDNFDGASFLSINNTPVLVINNAVKSIDRLRFTIIHELAHIILNFDQSVINEQNSIEKLCHKFASCFLLPSKKLVEMIGGPKRTHIYINELISIKEFYGISLRAIIFRLNEMEIITETYYKKWMVYLSKTYGKYNEPGNYNNEEKISIFEQLVNRALSEEVISISKAAFLLNVDLNELRKGFIGV